MGKGCGEGVPVYVCVWCGSGLRTAMSDVPPPKNAFEKMMAAARRGGTTPSPATVAADDEDEEPVYTAVLYEAHLEHADPEEPLWRVPYFGQVVRVGTAEAIFAKRKREHERDAAREDKGLGLHAVIDRFGPDAMAWRIVSSATGPRSAMQALANDEEIRLINEHGGVLRDQDAKLEQTLNLTKGGQPGDARARWEAIDARRKRAYTKLKVAMEAYVEAHESALVPREYVDADDGYPLGKRLQNFRQGAMWRGTPWEKEAKAWAEALPRWHWDARESDEYRKGYAQRGQARSREAFETLQAGMAKYVKKHDSALVPHTYVDDDGYPLGMQLSNFRQGQMWQGMPWENEAKAWTKTLPKFYWDARESDEYREGFAQRGQERSRGAFDGFKVRMEAYVEIHESALVPHTYVDDDGYRLGKHLNQFRQGKMWKGTSWEREAKDWAKALPKWHWKARESSEYREALSQRFQQQRDNETAEQKADRVTKFKKTMDNKTAEQKADLLAKRKKTMATDASKAKRRESTTKLRKRERCAELERARTIAAPFEKSKKRRAEMRKASEHTKTSGRMGENVLYMVSEDGKTIRRVQTDGSMGKTYIVGPVVDPPLPDAFDSD